MDALRRAAEWSGWPLTEEGHTRLEEFGAWLEREAIPQGGLGPNEGPRLRSRHLADSLLFASAWRAARPPGRLADVGSGVGLPGLPLAIVWPSTRVQLVERRGRRVDLARRATRLLGLENVEVVQADAKVVRLRVDMVVARAAAAPQVVGEWARRMVVPGGVVAVGGSWTEPPIPGKGEEVLEVPTEVLDRPVWLRIMAAS